MPETALVSVLTGSGVAGVFCVLFVVGWVYPRSVVADLKAERDALREAVRSEQERAEAAVAAAQASKDVFTALQAGMRIAREQELPALPAARSARAEVDLSEELFARRRRRDGPEEEPG